MCIRDRVTLFSEVHPEKTYSPLLTMLPGRVIISSDVPENEYLPRFSRTLGSSTERRPLSLKADGLIPVSYTHLEIGELWFEKPLMPRHAKTYNPAFDITDHTLITGFITDD